MAAKRKTTLSELLAKRNSEIPEEKQRREELKKCIEDRKIREQNRIKEELKRREEERIRLLKEGKITVVESLFELKEMAFGQKRYVPRIEELLEFLDSKENAIEFWKDPHIKMIYNVSDYLSFLYSIYAEETDNEKYEAWLRSNYSNPFFIGLIENYDCMLSHQRIKYSTEATIRFNRLTNLIRGAYNETPEPVRSEHFIPHDIGELEREKLILSVPMSNLIEMNESYKPLDELEEDEVHFINPIRKNEVCFVNPLYAMDNNFLRLDTYFLWKDRIPSAWAKIKEKNPKMFEILDALVKSRKIYSKWINR